MTRDEIAKLIPPEVVDAAAKCFHDRSDADMEHLSHGEFKPRPWETLPEKMRSSYYPAARATIAAGLAAWSGVTIPPWYPETIFFPSPHRRTAMADIVERWPHRRIYLEPRDCADPSIGPMWAEDDIGSEDENGASVAWEPYVKETELTTLRAENERLRAALHFNQRMAEETAFLLRDKRRTKAYGAVADMVERIACQFDRMAAKTRTALTTQEKQNE